MSTQLHDEGPEGVHAGDNDAFIRSYDSMGAPRWTVQYGTREDDMAFGIATDANGHVNATGYTRGTFEGATSAGGFDAYLRSYDSEGNLRWTRQFGAVSIDQAQAVATDETGNVYTVGKTNGALKGTNLGDYDAFIRTYGPDEDRHTIRPTNSFLQLKSQPVARPAIVLGGLPVPNRMPSISPLTNFGQVVKHYTAPHPPTAVRLSRSQVRLPLHVGRREPDVVRGAAAHTGCPRLKFSPIPSRAGSAGCGHAAAATGDR